MSGELFLQIFILIDVFLIGAVAAIALPHARAHFSQKKPEAQHPDHSADDAELPEAIKARMLKASEGQFQKVIEGSITNLQHSLLATTEDINGLIKKLAVGVVSNELETYKTLLTKLHSQAEQELGSFKQEMDTHKTDLQSKLAEEMTAEKQKLIKQIDTKLGDAVGSFLLETLQHNVDLGSQTEYLIAELEAHKQEFAKEVDDEPKPTR